MSGPWDLIVAGDLDLDIIVPAPAALPEPGQERLVAGITLAPGGSAAITAVAAARLGARVALVSRVGDDPIASVLVGQLRELGVDVDLLVRDQAQPSAATVVLSWPRDRAFLSYPGPTARLRGADVPDAALAASRHLHVAGYYLADALRRDCGDLLRRAHVHGLTTSLDTGDDPAATWAGGITALYPNLDLLFPNRQEALHLAHVDEPLAAMRRLARNVPTVVVKLDREGAIASVRGHELAVPAFAVAPVDTTGAGDTFDAGYLTGFLSGLPPAECLLRAAAAGALATTWTGGVDAALDLAAIEHLLATGRP